MILLWILSMIVGTAIIVWGAETFAEHLSAASVRLRVRTFALALLLAGAEPEELATTVMATLKDAPGIAFGDVIGANIAICLVALGVGALMIPLPFGNRVMRYALFGLPIGIMAVGFIWDGRIDRLEALILVSSYVFYVASIWYFERKPPSLGEVSELVEAELEIKQGQGISHWVGKDLLLVLAGIIAMIFGSTLLVEAVQQISSVETTQTKLGLTLVGFATAFELVVLAWSSARRGMSETVVAAVVGSFAYNVSMSLGVAALIKPLIIANANLLHLPLVLMLSSLVLVILLAAFKGYLDKTAGYLLLGAYPLLVLIMMLR
jgi:cation:H+ antiporter